MLNYIDNLVTFIFNMIILVQLITSLFNDFISIACMDLIIFIINLIFIIQNKDL